MQRVMSLNCRCGCDVLGLFEETLNVRIVKIILLRPIHDERNKCRVELYSKCLIQYVNLVVS